MPRFVRNCWVDTEFTEGGRRRCGPSFGPKTTDGEVMLKILVRKDGEPFMIGYVCIGPRSDRPGIIEAAFIPAGPGKTKLLYQGKR